MEPKYKLGQEVTIQLIKNQTSSARESDIRQYAGQRGIVLDFYWIQPNTGGVFYIYTVKVGDNDKEIVLHEDEIKVN